MNQDNLAEPSDVDSNFRHEKIQFHGEGKAYFKIWIVNLLLSILTLGIYSAWAKVRSKRYFYGNTEIDGSAFEYHATPMMILKGRLIAVTAFIVFLLVGRFYPFVEPVLLAAIALVMPWVIWRSIIFNARVSSYRNVRFSYIGKCLKFYWYLLLLPAVPLLLAALVIGISYLQDGEIDPVVAGSAFGPAVLVFYLLGPFLQQRLTSLYTNYHRYGQGLFSAKLEPSRYYIIYLKLIGLGLLFGLLFSAVLGLLAVFSGSWLDFKSLSQGPISPTTAIAMNLGIGAGGVMNVGFLVVILSMIFISKAYLQSRVRNYVYGRTKLLPGVLLGSELKARRLCWILLSNTLILICTLGLAYPWLICRLTRYKLQTISIYSKQGLDGYVTQMQKRQNALGEEMGDVFDLDLDLGF